MDGRDALTELSNWVDRHKRTLAAGFYAVGLVGLALVLRGSRAVSVGAKMSQLTRGMNLDPVSVYRVLFVLQRSGGADEARSHSQGRDPTRRPSGEPMWPR